MRNRRQQDYNRMSRKPFAYEEQGEDEDQHNWQRNRGSQVSHNSNYRKNNRDYGNPKTKYDKFSTQALLNLIKPGPKQPEVQKREDYIKQKARNQHHAKPQPTPRGGKLYRQQYKQQKELMDKQIEEYKRKQSERGQNGKRILAKVDSDNQSQLEIQNGTEKGKKVANKPRDKQDLSSLSFSVDFPPIQNHPIQHNIRHEHNQQASSKKDNNEQNRQSDHKMVSQRKEDRKVENKQQSRRNQVILQKIADNVEDNDSWGIEDNTDKKDNWDMNEVPQNLNLNLPQQQNIFESSQNQGYVSNKQGKILSDSLAKQLNSLSLDQTQKQPVNVSMQDRSVSQPAKIQQHQESNQPKKLALKTEIQEDHQDQAQEYHLLRQIDKKVPIKNPARAPPKHQEKAAPTYSEIEQKIKSYESQQKASVFITFQAWQNILAVCVKQVDLIKLGITIKLDKNGGVKQNQYQEILKNYVVFNKTTHFFPNIGLQREDEHYVDMDHEPITFDQTNQAEFKICQLKVSQQEIKESDKINESLLSVGLVAILCKYCSTQNLVAVLPDLTVLCSCRGLECSEKMVGKISKMRIQIC